MAAAMTEDRVVELIKVSMQSRAFNEQVEGIVKGKFEDVETRLQALERELNTYLRQIEGEVQKSEEYVESAGRRAAKAIKDVKDEVDFLDTKRLDLSLDDSP